jgi:ATP-dependent DNA helicase PIF1
MIERAIRLKNQLEIVYLKPDDTKSKRTVQPLAMGEMAYKGKSYLGLKAFCLTRQEERTFRIDRILELEVIE